MGVIEKAGGSIHDIAAERNKKTDVSADEPQGFDLDYARFAETGLYHPDAKATQLALELRAVKRRLLRRIGFLRASGERQAFRMPGRQRNLIMVTSARAGEGKTFSAANLALSLALEDQIETLLVDADVPRPKVCDRFGLRRAGPGLTDKLLDPSLAMRSLQYRANQAPLSILPEGAAVDRVSELFAKEDCQRVFTELSTEMQDRLVIIDAPPVLATTEAVILAKYVDEIVFVVEANATPEPAVASAIDELLDINSNVSLMLNRCLIGSGGSHYGSYEFYGPSGEAESQTSQGARVEGDSNGAR